MKSSILAGLILASLLLRTGTPALPGDVVPIHDSNDEEIRHNDETFDRIEALRGFSDDLWARVAGEASVLSPLSAYIALAMTSGGARGSTIDAFNCLGIGNGENLLTPDALGRQMHTLIDSLTAVGGSTKLSIANSVWVDSKFALQADFSDFLAENYAADTFNTELTKSVAAVNSWISERTGGMIPDMLDEIAPDVALLLINAIYMDAKWADPFDSYATYKQDFTHASGDKEPLDMMHKTSRMNTIDSEGIEGISLPYDDRRLHFVALMPTDGSTTDELISRLNGELSIAKLDETAVSERVRLTLPKLELESTISLGKPLTAMGMGGIFDCSANFSGLCESNFDFCVSEVLQKAKLKLDEDGTKAAAATIVSVKTTSIGFEELPREMAFDEPFVWAVVDSLTGTTLFCGQVD